MASRFKDLQLSPAEWEEREGDALFYLNDLQTALRLYEAALTSASEPFSIWLKLSDVHFMLGNLEKEKIFREKIYGSLTDKESP